MDTLLQRSTFWLQVMKKGSGFQLNPLSILVLMRRIERPTSFLDDCASAELMNEISEIMDSFKFPQSPAEWKAAHDEAAKLPEDERKKRGCKNFCVNGHLAGHASIPKASADKESNIAAGLV